MTYKGWGKRWGLAFGALLFSVSAHAYYGLYSTEAWLRFDAYVDAPLGLNQPPSVDELNQDGTPARAQAVSVVEKQVRHLLGVFQSESLKKEFGYLGALSEDDHEIRFTALGDGSAKGRYRLSYSFRSKVVFDKRLFGPGQTDVEIPYLKLPLQPDRIYKMTFSADGKNHCTDDQWQDAGDFWYFFDPDRPKCPLRGNSTDVVRVSGVLSLIPNTRLTYPRYDLLYGDNGDGDLLKIAVFYGYIDAVTPQHVKKSDDGYRNMKLFEAQLQNLGFTLDGDRSRDEFRVKNDGSFMSGIGFLHYWRKPLSDFDGNKREVEVQILLSDTDSKSRDATFHTYLKPALEAVDLLVYDGHAGTGENLDLHLEALTDLRMDPSKYQIFFLNGCSTYPYFKNMYFDAKGDASHLELITSGLEVATSTSLSNMLAFLGGFLDGKTLSNQNILQKLDHSNGREGTFLYGVNGDETSDWKPNP